MKKVLLCILDGWGIAPPSERNGVTSAVTPFIDSLFNEYPHSKLQASEEFVGLPKGQMGNSEVGHMAIGLGRVVLQDLLRIENVIADLAINPEMNSLISKLQNSGGKCHVIGLLSPGGVHSHQDHIRAILDHLLSHKIDIYLHGITDGRDCPPKSATEYVKEFQDYPWGVLAGRYYAMDRDKRFERTQLYVDAILQGVGKAIPSPVAAILDAYALGQTDEFILPYVFNDYSGIAENDAVIFVNFRADRMRQLVASLAPNFALALAINPYHQDVDSLLHFLSNRVELKNSLGELVSNAGYKQSRIAETEKYAHVTYFLNGGSDKEFAGESRFMLQSPKVATYDLTPEMAANAVSETVLERLGLDDLIVVNYANPDMIGHTGNKQAVIDAMEALDSCLAKIVQKARELDYITFLTADHGNAEEMGSCDNPHTAHTCNPVPLLLVNKATKYSLVDGTLADIAPTILKLMEISAPQDMDGKSLIG